MRLRQRILITALSILTHATTSIAQDDYPLEYIDDTTQADVDHCIARPYATDRFAACIGRALYACTDRYGRYLPNPRPCNVNLSIALRDAIPKQFADHPPLVDAFHLHQKANRAICAEASKRSGLPSFASDYCILDRTLKALDAIQAINSYTYKHER